MKAILCEQYGPVANLKYQDVADPHVQKGMVLVNIKAIGINFPDALLVQGLYQAKPPLPFIPGAEFAGEVAEVGEGVKSFSVGNRVLGFSPTYGAFAEKISIPAPCLIPIPASMSFNDAANLLCAHGTAHHALKQRARLQPGETLVVLGAAGGTGIAAVQIGKALGAKVVAVCSSEQKLAAARASGADEGILYNEQTLKKDLKALTNGKGADVVFDPVGGEAFTACAGSMARNGRLLVVGFASGTIPSLPVNLTLVKEFSVIGVFWGSFVMHEPTVFAQNMQELFYWHAKGQVKLVTDEVMPLSEAATALNRLLDRKVIGKVVLQA